jgi:hypothetical protein
VANDDGFDGTTPAGSALPVASAVALALYVAYWIAALFGYVRIDSSDLPSALFELLRAAAVLLPALAFGFAVGRFRAVLAGLVFLVAAALPAHTVIDGQGVDVTLVGTYGVSLGEALVLIAVTTPCVIAGVALRRMRRAPGRVSGASARESDTPSAAGAPSAPS